MTIIQALHAHFNSHRRKHCALALLCAAPVLQAALPPYGLMQLQARANLVDSFNLPVGASITNSTPAINASRTVAIRTFAATQGIWIGVNGAGGIVYTAPEDAFLSDPRINTSGLVVFPRNFFAPNGVYRIDPVTRLTSLLTNQPLGASSFGAVNLNDAGEVAYRAGFQDGNAWVSWSSGATAIHATDNGIGSSPYSALLTPNFGGNREIAGVVREGMPGMIGSSQPDYIRVFSSTGSFRTVAADRDANASADIVSFDNGAPINTAGDVAFIATLTGSVRVVRRVSASGSSVEIARAPSAQLAAIEFFAPVINDAGLVAFRGRDAMSRQAIFVGDGSELRAIITRGDALQTDLGVAQIEQNTPADAAFSGGLGINQHADLVFAAALTPLGQSQVEWGTGLFVARAAGDLIFSNNFD